MVYFNEEKIIMIEVEDLRENEAIDFLRTASYGHLGCSRDDQAYVVPVHFVYDGPEIYIYTTEGKKSEIIKRNPKVCLQVEDVTDNKNWTSVIVFGKAEQVADEAEREKAFGLITAINPTLTPAVSIRWMDSWVRQNIEVVLRITPESITGRASVNRSETASPVVAPVID